MTQAVTLANAGVQGSAKAWVNFNGVPSSPSIYVSYNVSSVTKIAAGNYTVNFTNALVDSNYLVSGTANSSTSGAPSNSYTWLAAGAGAYAGTFARSTTSCNVQGVYTTAGQSDADYINVVFHR